MLVFALVLLGSELAEPLNPVITALVFVALGAATLNRREVARMPEDTMEAALPDPRRHNAITLASWVLCAIALVPAALLVIGDVAYAEGTVAPPLTQTAMSDANTAETLLSPWPQPAALWASIDSVTELNALPQAVHWEQAAVARDRTNPLYLSQLAAMEISTGQTRGARGRFRKPSTTNPGTRQHSTFSEPSSRPKGTTPRRGSSTASRWPSCRAAAGRIVSLRAVRAAAPGHLPIPAAGDGMRSTRLSPLRFPLCHFG